MLNSCINRMDPADYFNQTVSMNTTEVSAMVVRGHRIASGTAKDSPYPKGSLEMQAPFFRERGLDLADCYLGTINLDLSPLAFAIVRPDFTFRDFAWADGFPPETFSFVACEIGHRETWVDGYVYYPHPETKIGHFQARNTIEVIAPFIEGLSYGDTVRFRVDPAKMTFTSDDVANPSR